MADVEAIPEDTDVPVKRPGFQLTLTLVIVVVAVSVVYLLVVGLLSGLVFRKIGTCDSDGESGAQTGDRSTTRTSFQSTTTTATTTPTTTTRTTTTTTVPGGSSSSSSSPTTQTTTTTTPSSSSSSSSSSSTTRSTTTTTTTTTTTPTTTSSSSSSTTSTTTTTTTGSSSTTTTTTTTTGTTRTLPTQSTLSTTTAFPSPPISNNIRLPNIFEPTNYDLTMNVKFDPTARAVDETDFDGKVDITFNLKNSTRELLFHAHKHILIQDPLVLTNLDSNDVITVAPLQHGSVKNDYHYANLGVDVTQGRYKLSVIFKNSNRSLYGSRGMFASKYLDDLVERTLVATVFTPNDARRVFPCFDEPQLRATFDITIQHPIGSFAISNVGELSTTVFNQTENKYIETKFKTTPKMSTYALGWAILPDWFTYEEVQTANGVPVRLYNKKLVKAENLYEHALDVAKKSIDYFNDYLNVSGAVLDKIDIISLPDFPYDAVESWGLAMLRETSVLYSSERDSAAVKQYVALEVAMSVAQLWFGNLVTMSWWDSLWFNKAAANYLKYKVVDSIFPDWKLNDQFIPEEILPAMWDDGFESTHPLQAKVETTGEIISIFDTVTNSKGAALMRMVESIVEGVQFQKGLQNYLNKNKESGVGVISDFYSDFILPAEMSSTTPEKFLLTWVLQKNYPVIRIGFDRGENSTTYKFEQDRFYLSIFDEEFIPEPSPFNYTWQVLLKCKAGGVSNETSDESQHIDGDIVEFTLFMDKKNATWTYEGQRFTWVKCNAGFNSYYTTEYAPLIYEGLFDVLERATETFAIADRANLLHVAHQLAYKGLISYSVPTIFSYYLEYTEREYVPWKVFTYHIDIIADLLEHRPSFKQLASFGSAFGEIYNSFLDIFGDADTPKEHLQLLLEGTTLEFLCRLQDGYCLYNITEQYYKIPRLYFEDPNDPNVVNPVPPNIRASVYRYHLQNTYNYNDWFDIYDLYVLSGDPQEKQNALIALTYSRLTWILNLNLLEILEDSSKIKRQDAFTVINNIARNPSGRHLAWYFYRRYYEDLVNLFGLEDAAFGQSIKYITSTFEDKFFIEEMYDFFYSHPYAGSSIFAREEALDVAANNVYWIQYREKDVTDNFVP